jgi:hypothetical protein
VRSFNLEGDSEMRSRVTFSIVVAVVFFANTHASGLEVDGTTNSGIFSVDTPCVGTVVCLGTGTNAFSWGTPANVGAPRSSLLETGTTFENAHVANTPNTPPGPPPFPPATEIAIGYLTFTNGMTNAGTEVSDVRLKISLGGVFVHSSNPPVADAHTNTDFPPLLLGIINTPNSPNPLEPDIIQIFSGLCTALDDNNLCVPGHRFDQFNVGEGETKTVAILGFLGTAFVSELSANKALYPGVDCDPPTCFLSSSAVPESSSLVLVAGGLIALLLARQGKGPSRPDICRR